MYEFVTHTWNTIKGKCPHDCSYCYMKRWGKQPELHFDEKEFKEFDRDIEKYGEGQFIFVGSSCDMWAQEIPDKWIERTLHHCEQFDNKYLFQTKNPDRILDFIHTRVISDKSIVCTTIESDIYYPDIMKNAPLPIERAIAMDELNRVVDTYVTIEPIMDFNLANMIKMVKRCYPKQVNIGANSWNKVKLPEPEPGKLLELIAELKKFTKVHLKKNLKRILK